MCRKASEVQRTKGVGGCAARERQSSSVRQSERRPFRIVYLERACEIRGDMQGECKINNQYMNGVHYHRKLAWCVEGKSYSHRFARVSEQSAAAFPAHSLCRPYTWTTNEQCRSAGNTNCFEYFSLLGHHHRVSHHTTPVKSPHSQSDLCISDISSTWINYEQDP